jgi:hypothetical protein
MSITFTRMRFVGNYHGDASGVEHGFLRTHDDNEEESDQSAEDQQQDLRREVVLARGCFDGRIWNSVDEIGFDLCQLRVTTH